MPVRRYGSETLAQQEREREQALADLAAAIRDSLAKAGAPPPRPRYPADARWNELRRIRRWNELRRHHRIFRRRYEWRIPLPPPSIDSDKHRPNVG